MRGDTIAAIATAITNAGIGIVRISGEESFQIIDRIYKSGNGKKKLSQADSHTVHYGYIYDGEKMVDEVMVLILKSPQAAYFLLFFPFFSPIFTIFLKQKKITTLAILF